MRVLYNYRIAQQLLLHLHETYGHKNLDVYIFIIVDCCKCVYGLILSAVSFKNQNKLWKIFFFNHEQIY